MNNLRQTKVLLYRLKRNFGLPIILRNKKTLTQNVETGKVTITYDQISIARAVMLSKIMSRDFVYDLAYIAANKNFTDGAYFDKTVRFIIIDGTDFTKAMKTAGVASFDVTFDTEIIFNNRRWNMMKPDRGEDNSYLLQVKELSNTDAESGA